jgi:hypothetical protein
MTMCGRTVGVPATRGGARSTMRTYRARRVRRGAGSAIWSDRWASTVGHRARGRRQDPGGSASIPPRMGLIPLTRGSPRAARPPRGRVGPSTARRPPGAPGAAASMLSVHIRSPTCAQRSRGNPRATSAMNARRWAAVHARGKVMMRAPVVCGRAHAADASSASRRHVQQPPPWSPRTGRR